MFKSEYVQARLGNPDPEALLEGFEPARVAAFHGAIAARVVREMPDPVMSYSLALIMGRMFQAICDQAKVRL